MEGTEEPMALYADPTRDEMLELLNGLAFADEFDDFAREEAIYWFARDYHGGQWTNLYRALCASPFHPGPIGTGPEDTYLYEALETAFLPGTAGQQENCPNCEGGGCSSCLPD
jgi:hypothetical protein